ncbi:MAG: hypothetical protein U1F76_31630 [Candidatus Competibacteraceae bacterium]
MRFSNGKLYGLVPCQVYQDGRLSRSHLRLLLALLCHADAEGRCQFRRAQLSRELGIPEAQVAATAQDLSQLGWLDRQDKGEHSKAWFYRVKVPEPVELPTEMAMPTGTADSAMAVGAVPDNTPAPNEPVPESIAAADGSTDRRDRQGLSEPAIASVPDPTIITIPLLGRDGEFAVTEAMVVEWQDAFPGVDVYRTLKRIRLWCLDNPARRKTRRGVRRFLTGWLAREQDRGIGHGGRTHGGRTLHDWLKGAL